MNVYEIWLVPGGPGFDLGEVHTRLGMAIKTMKMEALEEAPEFTEALDEVLDAIANDDPLMPRTNAYELCYDALAELLDEELGSAVTIDAALLTHSDIEEYQDNTMGCQVFVGPALDMNLREVDEDLYRDTVAILMYHEES